MKIIIPMAGTGDRFVNKGYAEPKPLIQVGDKKIIDLIVSMFDFNDEIIFICNQKHIQETNMKFYLQTQWPNAKVAAIPNHKLGPVHTVINSGIDIEDDEEVIVSYCDNPYLWDYQAFKNFIKEKDSDGCILSHAGFHPHRLNSTFLAHMKEDNLLVSEIKEKEPYDLAAFMDEHASTGTYYFKSGKILKKYFEKALQDKLVHSNGEYYVTLVYNLLIKDGLKVHCYPTDYVSVLGLPEYVENFCAWQTIIKSGQVKNEEEVLKVYQYWKGYYELRDSQEK